MCFHWNHLIKKRKVKKDFFSLHTVLFFILQTQESLISYPLYFHLSWFHSFSITFGDPNLCCTVSMSQTCFKRPPIFMLNKTKGGTWRVPLFTWNRANDGGSRFRLSLNLLQQEKNEKNKIQSTSKHWSNLIPNYNKHNPLHLTKNEFENKKKCADLCEINVYFVRWLIFCCWQLAPVWCWNNVWKKKKISWGFQKEKFCRKQR